MKIQFTAILSCFLKSVQLSLNIGTLKFVNQYKILKGLKF